MNNVAAASAFWLQKELLLTNKDHVAPALAGLGHKNTASFIPTPELIAVVGRQG